MINLKLIRSGSCNRCGTCCEGCHNFTPPNICIIYPTRGQGCRNWPPHPFECPPYCQFKFYDAVTGEEIKGYKDRRLLDIYESINEEC